MLQTQGEIDTPPWVFHKKGVRPPHRCQVLAHSGSCDSWIRLDIRLSLILWSLYNTMNAFVNCCYIDKIELN